MGEVGLREGEEIPHSADSVRNDTVTPPPKPFAEMVRGI